MLSMPWSIDLIRHQGNPTELLPGAVRIWSMSLKRWSRFTHRRPGTFTLGESPDDGPVVDFAHPRWPWWRRVR